MITANRVNMITLMMMKGIPNLLMFAVFIFRDNIKASERCDVIEIYKNVGISIKIYSIVVSASDGLNTSVTSRKKYIPLPINHQHQEQ